MAANMQHMMMPPGQQGQQQHPMRGGLPVGLQQRVSQAIIRQPIPPNTWQASYQPRDRLSKAISLITNIALSLSNVDFGKAGEAGVKFERDVFLTNQTKEMYEQQMDSKIEEFFQKRKDRGPNVQHALNAQAAVQAQAQAQAQQLLMNPNAMMQMGRGMGPGPGPQQGFQHMQHPAQGSPMPQQQQAQMGMHMNQAGMGMHIGMAGPGGQPMGPNGQMMGMMAGRQGPGPGRPQPANPNGPSGLSAQDRIQVFERAQKQFNAMSDAQKNQLRTNTINRLAPEHVQAIQSQGKDPALFLLQQQMAHEALKAKAAAASPMNMNPNSAQAAQAAMLRQRQISQQGGMNASPHPMPANYGQFENLINQQKAGMMAQEAGQVVVPASNPQGGRNPNQPQGMGHMPNLNMTHPQANLGQAPQPQPDQRQMGMDQQQMLHQGQGKQGGGGGMASQSPGQPAPNRPPGEQGMEGGQGMAQGAAPFNSGLDPRFNQVQRPSPAGMPNNGNNPFANNALFAGMNQDQQRLFLNLPTNKQIEFLQRANTQQKNMGARPGGPQGLMNQGNGQGGNVPMMGQGGGMMNNVGPGQVPNLPPVNQGMADNMDVPPQIIAALKMTPEPKTWRDLKQMCAQNPAMQPHMQKLFNWQRQQYFALLQRPGQQGQAQQGMGGQGMPNQAAGQMMNRPQGMPMNMGNLQHNLQQIHVSDQDIALLRANEPKVSQMSDDEVRAYIANMKMVQYARRQQQLQQQLHQQQLAQQQQAAVSSAAMQAHPSTGATSMQQQQSQQQQQQQLHPPPQSQPPQPGTSPAGQGPGAQGANQPPKKTAKKAGNQKPAATKSPAQAQKGVKRPFEDTTETPAQKNVPNQRAGVQQSQGQPSGVLPPGADQRTQAQKQQQQMAAGRDPSEDTKRLKAIAETENRRVAQEPIIEVSLTPEQRLEHLNKIVTLAREVGRTGKAVTKWYGLQRDDERAAIYFHTRCKLARQFEDGETLKKPKQILTMTADEVRQGFEVIKTIWLDCQRAVAAASKTQQGAAGQSRTPLSAANLEAQTAALNNNNNQNLNKAQQAQRPGSKPGQPGAQAQAQQAQVTTATGAGAAAGPASFQLSATSPHGQPKYMNPAKDMNLHIPPKKRAKVNNAKQQGGPQSATPAASEAEKQDTKPPAKPVFYCTEKDCEMATTGFPTEEDRQAHIQTEHVQPKENPLNFFKENFAASLGLDNEGNVVDMSTPTGAAMMSATQSKQGQTPVSFAPTPMSRGPSMNRSASGTGARPQGGKAGGTKAGTPAGKAGAATGPTSKTPTAADAYAGASTTIDPQALFQGIPGFDPVTGGLFSDPTVFQALTPNDTPESSKDSGSSEPMTDLPEFGGVGDADPQWHALGDGFTMMAASSADPGLLVGAGDTEVDVWDGGLLAGEAGADMLDIDWNEVNVDFSKPLGLDTSLYSMDPTSDAFGLGA